MKKQMLCCLALLVGATFPGGAALAQHTKDKTIRDERELPAFNRIALNGAYTLIYVNGDFSVAVEGTPEGVNRVSTTVENGTLTVKPAEKNVKIFAKIYVTAPSLNEMQLNGAGSFTAEEEFATSGDLYLMLSGAGKIRTNGIRCGNLQIDQNGAGSFADKGTIDCDILRSDISGSGRFSANHVNCTDLILNGNGGTGSVIEGKTNVTSATLTVNGAGNMRIDDISARTIKAQIKGVGKIKLAGSTDNLDKSVAGIGAINTDGLTVGH